MLKKCIEVCRKKPVGQSFSTFTSNLLTHDTIKSGLTTAFGVFGVKGSMAVTSCDVHWPHHTGRWWHSNKCQATLLQGITSHQTWTPQDHGYGLSRCCCVCWCYICIDHTTAGVCQCYVCISQSSFDLRLSLGRSHPLCPGIGCQSSSPYVCIDHTQFLFYL